MPAQGRARPGARGTPRRRGRADPRRTCCPSNEEHLRRAFELVARTGKRKVGLFGLSFKPGTDDLRESPLVELAERLLGKGYDLRIYDANVSDVAAARREPRVHRGSGCRTSASCSPTRSTRSSTTPRCAWSACKDPAVLAALPHGGDKTIVDLVRIPDAEARRAESGYVGLAW